MDMDPPGSRKELSRSKMPVIGTSRRFLRVSAEHSMIPKPMNYVNEE